MATPVLNKVFKKLGSQANLARALRVSPQAITKWIDNGVPAERVLDVERACDGVVTRYDIRPDLYPRDHGA